MYKSEKPYLVYLSVEHEPLSLMAYNYAEVVHKAIEFIRNNKLVATIRRVEEIKLI